MAFAKRARVGSVKGAGGREIKVAKEVHTALLGRGANGEK